MRECHSAVCVGYGGDKPQLVIIHGRNVDDGGALKDVWMLDINSGMWKEVGETLTSSI